MDVNKVIDNQTELCKAYGKFYTQMIDANNASTKFYLSIFSFIITFIFGIIAIANMLQILSFGLIFTALGLVFSLVIVFLIGSIVNGQNNKRLYERKRIFQAMILPLTFAKFSGKKFRNSKEYNDFILNEYPEGKRFIKNPKEFKKIYTDYFVKMFTESK